MRLPGMPLGNRRFYMLRMKTVSGFTVSTGHTRQAQGFSRFY